MSSRVWIRGAVCGVDNCRSRLYQRTDGRMRCQFGHIAEGSFEFDDEDEFTAPGGILTRRVKHLELSDSGRYTQSQRSQGVVQKSQEKLEMAARFPIYLRCSQMLLQRYLRIIIRLAGIEAQSEVITACVKRLWIKYARNSRPPPAAHMRIDSCLATSAECITIIYVACMLHGAGPVYVDDLITWWRNNDIPTSQIAKMGWFDDPELEADRIETKLLSTSGYPVRSSFEKRVMHVVNRALGSSKMIAVPINYYTPFLYRLVARLHLPPRIVDVVRAIWPQPEIVIKKSPSRIRLAETIIAARVVYIAKLYVRQPSFDRTEWSAAYNRARVEFRPLDIAEYGHPELWSEAQIKGYLKNFIDKMVDRYTDSDPSTRVRRLFKMFDYTTVNPDELPDRAEPALGVLSVSEFNAALVAECARMLCIKDDVFLDYTNYLGHYVKEFIFEISEGYRGRGRPRKLKEPHAAITNDDNGDPESDNNEEPSDAETVHSE
ncbi:hypothetical protein DIRU0_B01464 [Diutina rugosa]